MLGADMVVVPQRSDPTFQVRRWTLTDLQGPLEDFKKYDNGATLLHNAIRMKRYIDLAPKFGINSIELTGRPNEGGIDLDWLTTYRNFPKAARRGLEGELIRDRLDVVRQVARWCKAQNLELMLWHHEIYLPKLFYQAYPEVRGVDYSLCFSHPLVGEVIEGKIEEFFEAVPEADGLVLSMCECGGVEPTSDEGCKCPKCRALDIPARLTRIIDFVRRPLRARGKKLVVRTFTHARFREVLRHSETEHMLKAFSGLPADVVLMSKYCPVDFFGYEYPDDALIGAFKNPHLVEFTLCREIVGGTYTPNLTPRDFKRRFENAAAKKCLGVVGRVDSPTSSDDPYTPLDHPNAFNLYCFARLAQDVTIEVDRLWDDYLAQRYPKADKGKLRRVLEPSEAMGQKIYLTRGNYGLSYAHRVPHPITQAAVTFEFLALAKWRKDKLDLYHRIQNADPTFIDEALAEKDEAARLARQSLDALAELRGQFNNEFEFLQLKLGLLRSEQAARFWRALSEVYFTGRCLAAGTSSDFDRLTRASQDLFDLSREIRRDFGREAWPTTAGPMRGVGAEQFVVEVHRDLLYRFQNQAPPRHLYCTYTDYPVYLETFPRGGVEHLWRVLVNCADADADASGPFVDVTFGSPIRQVVLHERKLTLVHENGNRLDLPLFDPVEAVELPAGTHRLAIRRTGNRLDVRPVPHP